MTRVDNSSNVTGKQLNSVRFDLSVCAYVRVTRQHVPHNTTATAYAYGLLESAVENQPDDTTKSWLVTTTATAQVNVVDRHLGDAWNELRRFASAWTETSSMQNSAATLTGGLLVGSASLIEHDPENFKKTIIDVTSWSDRVRYEIDPELLVWTKITESVVAPAASLPDNTSTEFYQQRQVSDAQAIRTKEELGKIVAGAFVADADEFDRIYYDTVQMSWPALFTGWSDIAATFEPQQRRSVYSIYFNVRAAFSGPCHARVQENLITSTARDTLIASTPSGLGSASVRAALWLPKPVDHIYNGVLFNVNIPNVISDADSIEATTNSEDTYYGYPITDTFAFSASSPTYAEYLALIGTEVCIEDSLRPAKPGLWMRRRMYVKVQ